MELKPRIMETDILIIGGGTAGCYAALNLADNSDVQVLVAEKANIVRSGCLAAGVNAINAYLDEEEAPEAYVEYVREDSEGIIREDLAYTIAERLHKVTRCIEGLGLTILKDNEGKYIKRGKRSIKINGENIKPILANAVYAKKNIRVLNKTNMIDYITVDDKVIGAYGFSLEAELFYVVYAKAVICTTGGASGLYKPNNPGFSRHKLWYSPFNTGAGYAMGIRAGAEMTTFEMRFIALRCKDTIAPTGTIAQGVGAKQVNSQGEKYVGKYDKPTTPMRLYATVQENYKGRGPCYLDKMGISEEQEQELYKAYLNMAPAQTLKWIEQEKGPRKEKVEIEGTEPYVVGGHTASGYWVDAKRATTLEGLYAAGDVAGGSPKKYVTGCFAEGEIAAISALEYIKDRELVRLGEEVIDRRLKVINSYFKQNNCKYSIEQIEEAMQKVMDEYAGGIATGYIVNSSKLEIAAKRIEELLELSRSLTVTDLHQLLFIHELKDRLEVCKVLIAHLLARKETRWPCYNQNADFSQKKDESYLKYINSRVENGEIRIIFRELIRRNDVYEHNDRQG